MKSSRHGVQYRGHLRDASRCLLNADNVIDFGESLYGRWLDVHASTSRHAVKNNRQAGGARDRAIMLVKTFLGRLVVVGRDRKDAVDADGGEFASQRDDFSSVVASGPGEHRDLPLGNINGEFYDA